MDDYLLLHIKDKKKLLDFQGDLVKVVQSGPCFRQNKIYGKLKFKHSLSIITKH